MPCEASLPVLAPLVVAKGVTARAVVDGSKPTTLLVGVLPLAVNLLTATVRTSSVRMCAHDLVGWQLVDLALPPAPIFCLQRLVTLCAGRISGCKTTTDAVAAESVVARREDRIVLQDIRANGAG
eukprot:scaffold73837_cov69-Phaeocystis_antarctica.AAC.6